MGCFGFGIQFLQRDPDFRQYIQEAQKLRVLNLEGNALQLTDIDALQELRPDLQITF
ncbi:hypothetical protein OAN21_01915 [Alphaproteobacteria bacterium]|nr:hypothetical protein [Alphaproteobacteria bacterium]